MRKCLKLPDKDSSLIATKSEIIFTEKELDRVFGEGKLFRMRLLV
jgi:hypothetical protein